MASTGGSTTAAKIDAGSAVDRAKKQTTTALSTMVSRRPLMFEEAIEPVVQGMSEEERFLLDMQGCKHFHLTAAGHVSNESVISLVLTYNLVYRLAVGRSAFAQ